MLFATKEMQGFISNSQLELTWSETFMAGVNKIISIIYMAGMIKLCKFLYIVHFCLHMNLEHSIDEDFVMKK